MILDVLLQNCVFCQTNHLWKQSNDLKLLRKSKEIDIKIFKFLKHLKLNHSM